MSEPDDLGEQEQSGDLHQAETESAQAVDATHSEKSAVSLIPTSGDLRTKSAGRRLDDARWDKLIEGSSRIDPALLRLHRANQLFSAALEVIKNQGSTEVEASQLEGYERELSSALDEYLVSRSLRPAPPGR